MAATTPDRALAGALVEGEFGPREAGGKPRSGGPDWIRVGFLALSIVLVFAVGMGGYYSYLIWSANNAITGGLVLDGDGPTFVPSPGADDEGLAVPETVDLEDRQTILLIGSDSRDGLTDEQLRAIGTDPTGTDLTDTIILLQIDPNTDAAAMLSFPRDLLVERCDGSTGRINGAYFVGLQQAEQQGVAASEHSEYGAACLIDTIRALTGIHIDHYARVNFAGFVQAVDALGGVSFYVETDLRDRYSGLDVEAGCVDFDGVTAIQFVRARRIDSDFGRIARQQRFAREMVRKASSLGTLLNPVTVTNLVRSVSSSLETDAEFGVSEMADLASSISGISAGTVDGRTVPGYGTTWGPEDASVVRMLEEEAEVLFTAFRNGDLLPDGVGQDAGPVELGPSNLLPIEVSAGGVDLATAERTAEVLEALGYTVSDVSQTDNYTFSGSIVFHGEMREDHAAFLAEALGGLQVSEQAGQTEEGEGVEGLRLVLGSDFDPEEFAPPEATEAPSEDGSPEPTATPTEEQFAGAELSAIEC